MKSIMAKAKKARKKTKPNRRRFTSKPATPELAAIERGLKTRIIALLMLILASSLGLWFASIQPFAIFLWLIIALGGGFAIFEYNLFISKALVIVSALVMEFLVLEGVPTLLSFGTTGNSMLLTFGVLDAVLIYALSKL